MTEKKVAVLAIGGNALIVDKTKKSIPDQFDAIKETMRHIAGMIEDGWDVVITHGNGPQVGFILRRSELALGELHPVPMDYCGADTQGAIGYMAQKALRNEFKKRGMNKTAVTIVTQVQVDPADPACIPRANQAAEINITAARSFNRGLRSVYFALGALAWLLGAIPLLVATALTVLILWRREFASHSRGILLQND